MTIVLKRCWTPENGSFPVELIRYVPDNHTWIRLTMSQSRLGALSIWKIWKESPPQNVPGVGEIKMHGLEFPIENGMGILEGEIVILRPIGKAMLIGEANVRMKL